VNENLLCRMCVRRRQHTCGCDVLLIHSNNFDIICVFLCIKIFWAHTVNVFLKTAYLSTYMVSNFFFNKIYLGSLFNFLVNVAIVFYKITFNTFFSFFHIFNCFFYWLYCLQIWILKMGPFWEHDYVKQLT